MTQRLHRDRDLPEGYQFGDARWRRPSDNAAEQLARRAHVHEPAAFDVGMYQHVCRCGARRCAETIDSPWVLLDTHWNVIEGDHH